jgi:diaminopimelate decarboxylase
VGGPPNPLYLEPRLEPRLAALMEAGGFLHSLAAGLGTPLNVVLPEQIAENAAGFRAVYERHRLGGEVFFAHKATGSSALVRRLAASDTRIDVASVQELQHALASGFAPSRIAATGPKDPAFLWLGARAGVAFHVDGRAELDELAALVRGHGLPRVRVLLRLSGFVSSGVRTLTHHSRFGTPAGEAAALLDAVEKHREEVEPVGVGYHLDTVSLDEKAQALEGCLRVMDACRERGMRPLAVDIGGGFGVSYLAHAAQWDAYTSELTRAVLGARPPLTWRGHGYGLRNESGTLAGGLGLYPSYRPVAGPGYLDDLLEMRAPGLGRPLATLLLESLYDLYTEPGRALADQCGLTLARVMEVRRADGVGSAAEWFVRLDMNAADCGLEDHGVLVDPLVVPRARAADSAEGRGPVGVHLFGNLCLESDLITKRVVYLPALPAPGDLLCFANTAAYCMDFGAHEAELRPRARRVAVTGGADGGWQWSLDEQYWPVGPLGSAREGTRA